MKNLNFPIIIEHDKNGYFVTCPELEGCSTQGDTYEEALKNIKEAIQLYMEDMISEGEKVPRIDSVSFSTVQITV